MAASSRPAIYEVQGFTHVLDKLPTSVGGRWKQAVNYTCLDASEDHLAVGSEQGFVCVVNIPSGKLVCKLNDREAREHVTHVKLNERYGYAAYGTKEGTLRIEPATKTQTTKKYTVFEQEKQPVTALTWSKDEPVLYCGYLSGKLVRFFFSFKTEVMQATRLPDCGTEVVQLSAFNDLLLISTIARAFLLNVQTLQITQVGRKDRKAGSYGGTFTPEGNKVLVARPGFRLFTADSGGQVLHTSIFGDSIRPQAVIRTSLQQLPPPSTVPTSCQFTFLVPWVSPLVVTYHERGVLWVLDPQKVEVMGYVVLAHAISSVCTCGRILYVLCNGCIPLVTRLVLSEDLVGEGQRGVATSSPWGEDGAKVPQHQQTDRPEERPVHATPDDAPLEEGPSPEDKGEMGRKDVAVAHSSSLGDQENNGQVSPHTAQNAMGSEPSGGQCRTQSMPPEGSPLQTTEGKCGTQSIPPEGSPLQTTEGQCGTQSIPLEGSALQTTEGQCETQSVPPEGSPLPASDVVSPPGPEETLKGEEPVGQDSKLEHTNNRVTVRGRFKPILSNLLHGTEGGVVSGLKDKLRPNMSLLTGMLHKEPEVPVTPPTPAAPYVPQLDNRELERIAKMAAAEEEESLHVRVCEQKRKSRRKRTTHKSSSSTHMPPEEASSVEVQSVGAPSKGAVHTGGRADLSVLPLAPEYPLQEVTSVVTQDQEVTAVVTQGQEVTSVVTLDQEVISSCLEYQTQQLYINSTTQGPNGDPDQGYVTNQASNIQKQVLETSSDQGQVKSSDQSAVDSQKYDESHMYIPVPTLVPVPVPAPVPVPVPAPVPVPVPAPVPAPVLAPAPVLTLAPLLSAQQCNINTSPDPGGSQTFSAVNSSVYQSELDTSRNMSSEGTNRNTSSLSKELYALDKDNTEPSLSIISESPPLSKEAPLDTKEPEEAMGTSGVDKATQEWLTKGGKWRRMVEEHPLYMESYEAGRVSNDESGSEKGTEVEDSPLLSHGAQTAHEDNGAEELEVASSPQNTGSNPQDTCSNPPQNTIYPQDGCSNYQDTFVDPLNDYEESLERPVIPKEHGEEAKQHKVSSYDDYIFAEVPKVTVKFQRSPGSTGMADIWCQLSNPSKNHIQCVCMSDQLMWATDSKGVYYSSASISREVSWLTLNKPVSYLATSASGNVVWGIHKGVAMARTGISKKLPSGQNWKATTKNNVIAKQVAVDEDSVWVLKNDGRVIQRKGVAPLVPEGNGWIDVTGSEVIAFSFIACCNRVVWALDMSGRPYVRMGISSSNITGNGWVITKNSPHLSAVSISSDGLVWIVDKEGMLGFKTGATPERPEGRGKWWEVAVSTPAPTSRFLPVMESLLTSSTEQSSTIETVNATGKAGVCVLDSSNKLRACWRLVTGYRYKRASKDGMFEVTIWNMVAASHQAKWLVRYDGGLYCLTEQRGLFPIELVSTAQHIATSPTCIWVVSTEDIWSRQGMTSESPEGISWDYIELSTQLRERGIRHIACSEYAAWVVDKYGTAHFRFGVHAREKGTGMSPAWIPVEDNPKPLAHLAVSPDTLTVWACDEDGCPYARTRVTKNFPVGGKWEPVHSEQLQILCAANGKVFAISKKGELLSRIGVTEGNPSGNYWRKMPGKNYKFLSTASSGELWVIDGDGAVFVQKSQHVVLSSELSSKDVEDCADNSEPKEKWELL